MPNPNPKTHTKTLTIRMSEDLYNRLMDNIPRQGASELARTLFEDWLNKQDSTPSIIPRIITHKRAQSNEASSVAPTSNDSPTSDRTH